jgi:DNA-binding response OmpR family regulator
MAGLLSGAVDYVKKPFSVIEILARVDAQIRLRDALAAVRRSHQPSLGDLQIDADSRRVMLGTVAIDLRRKEFDLLSELASNVGKVVRRDDLIEAVWGDNWWGSTKTLDVHINSLRRKLGESPGKPSRIQAIRGVGYRLEAR